MNCEPHNDLHTEECIKGTAPCDGFRCSVCGDMLPEDLQGNPNPTMCHDCANGYVGAAHREMDAVRASVNYSEPQSNDSYTHETESNYAAIGNSQTETIDITPVGCQTPEGNERVRQAQQEWDSVTHQLANTIKELMEDFAPDIHSAVNSSRAYAEAFHQIEALIGARERKQEAFLRAVAGR